jgi:hypothetical protein
MEEYKQIVDFDNYEVSNLGNVRNIKTGRILKTKNRNDYNAVNLCKNGKVITKNIHRLVGETFIENPDNKNCIDHIDGDKLNNNFNNLRWCSSSENLRNSKISTRNTSGSKGVSWNKNANKWKAQIVIHGIYVYLGLYETLEEAEKIRKQRANEAFGVFTHECEKN